MTAKYAYSPNTTTGVLEPIKSPDTLDATVNTTLATTVNVVADASLVIGNAVYISADGHVNLANAAAIGTAKCIGLIKDVSVGQDATCDVISSGELTATTGQWDIVAGTTGGLTAGADYYLGKTSGKIVSSLSGYTAGDFMVYIGHAISSTKLRVNPTTQIIAL